MKRSSWKVGSQLVDGGEPPTFEWNLCFSFNNKLISYVPLGIRTGSDPIVQSARELAERLNAAQPEE
jgi:hypothetical protein